MRAAKIMIFEINVLIGLLVPKKYPFDFDLDGFRFCFLSLLNLKIQHAIIERSANLSYIDIAR